MDNQSSDIFTPLSRASAPAIDKILGDRFPVLTDGFVAVVDYMGNDSSVVNAARISYGDGTKRLREDRTLLRYLMRHRHSTPFEMCEITLHVRVPMDTWRQWIRHRTASVNEYSTRYSDAIDSFDMTAQDQWRLQSTANRQGSSGFILPHSSIEMIDGAELSARELAFHEAAKELYRERLDAGVAREQARKDLPLSTYTEAFWKVNLRNLLHFLSLRADSHAQAEIRAYAEIILHEIVSRWVPESYQAFIDYDLESLTLSRLEIDVLSGREDISTLGKEGSRERLEFREKLDALDLGDYIVVVSTKDKTD